MHTHGRFACIGDGWWQQGGTQHRREGLRHGQHQRWQCSSSGRHQHPETRDGTRRQVLADELASEEKLLNEAKVSYNNGRPLPLADEGVGSRNTLTASSRSSRPCGTMSATLRRSNRNWPTSSCNNGFMPPQQAGPFLLKRGHD